MKTEAIYFRVSPEEKARIKSKADAYGLSISQYIRALALDELEVKADFDAGVYRVSVNTTSVMKFGEQPDRPETPPSGLFMKPQQ